MASKKEATAEQQLCSIVAELAAIDKQRVPLIKKRDAVIAKLSRDHEWSMRRIAMLITANGDRMSFQNVAVILNPKRKGG